MAGKTQKSCDALFPLRYLKKIITIIIITMIIKKYNFSIQKPLVILLITFRVIVSLEKLSSKA